MTNEVRFKVSGDSLAAYMDSIQRKSQTLTNEALKGALSQASAAKEHLSILNETIKALERKNRIEGQASRSILLDKRETSLAQNRDLWEGKRETTFADRSLSEKEKKERISTISGIEAAVGDKIKNDYRDNLTVLREQEKQSKLQTLLARENIETQKRKAEENVRAITSGNLKLSDVLKDSKTDEERLVASLTKQGVEKLKREESKGQQPSILGSLLAAENINKVFSIGGQFAQSQNGFDLIQPASNAAGRIIGGLVGGAIGALGGVGGAIAGAGIGSSIGGGLGDTIGALEQRQALSKEAFRKSILKYQRITGGTLDGTAMPDLSEMGINYKEFAEMRSEYAKRRGTSKGSMETTKDAVLFDRAYGLDQGTLGSLVEVMRSNAEGDKSLRNVLGGILEKGQGTIFKNGDTAFFGEFTTKFTALQKELLKSNSSVSSSLPFDILKQFNSLGGAFDARDSRSSGLISSINNSLANPASENSRAISFRLLHRLNPSKGIFSLREEMEKGMGSAGYLKEALNEVNRFGGDDEFKMENLAGMFKGVPRHAIRSLFENQRKLKAFNKTDLKAIGLTDSVLMGKANEATTDLEKNTSKIENGILSGNSIKEQAAAFENAVTNALSGAVIVLKNGQGEIHLKGSTSIMKNTAKGVEKTTKNPTGDPMLNPDGSANYGKMYEAAGGFPR